MRFVYDLTVTKNTLEADPVSNDIQLVKGRLTRVQVRFLRGCHNQVEVIMQDGLTRIVPVADSVELMGDGQIFSVSMDYKLNEKAPQVTVIGWSPGTIYDHNITWYLDVIPASGDERSSIEALFFEAASIGNF